jgi:ATP-binding cassette, subfamily A (ABC1), member 3
MHLTFHYLFKNRPNGAGKSSTFNILTSSIWRSGGNIKVNGIDFDSAGMKDVYRMTGFAAQNNIMWDALPVITHLRLFCDLKGYNNEDKEYAVDFVLRLMDMKKYSQRKSERLSGGNKRKLCVCIAILSNPKLLFLDEPSSGVDAVSRRLLWNTIKVSKSANSKSLHFSS